MEITDEFYEEDGETREFVVTVTASGKEVDKHVKQYFKELNKNEVPGFRKGKAPQSVLEQGVGGHEKAYGGVAEHLINAEAFKVLDDADILFIGEPDFNVDRIPEDHKEFSFTVSGTVPPEVTLSDYGPVSINMPPDEATEAEIEEHIENLRDYYHTFEDVTDPEHKAAMGDYVNCTMTCTKADGSSIRGLSEVKRLVGLGEGTMPASFDEHIIGAKAGDELEFDFEVETKDDKGTFGDGKLHAEVEVDSFRKIVIPELDDEFASKLGSSSVEELKKAVKMALDMDKRKELPALMVDRCMEQLVDRINEEIPAYIVDVLKNDVGRELVQGLDKDGSNLQEWMMQNDVQREELQQQIEAEALHRAKCDSAIEALFKELKMEITDEEIEKTLAHEEEDRSSRKAWEDACRMADLRKLVRQDMVTRWLVKTAEVTVVE